MKSLSFFLKEGRATQNVAIFISGSGTNAEKILESISHKNHTSWQPSVIITDAPQKSNAPAIAAKFGVPLIKNDIKQFYKDRGEKRVSLQTENGQKIRQMWTDELRKILLPYQIDFGILAGFIPLSNITADFPCLNVHPGDLTVEREGKRLLVGLHTRPIETAILNNMQELRSSVIIAETYTGKGGEMDSGPILGISEPAPIDFMGISIQELKKTASARPLIRPFGGYKDILETVAKYNQEGLKRQGDWVVFPGVINDFASRKFAFDSTNKLYYRQKNEWIAIKTVVYGKKGKKLNLTVI